MAKMLRNLLFYLIILIIIITIFISFFYSYIYFNKYKAVKIETKLGPIIGTSVTRFGKKVNCFFGVPYAEAPVGPLRFKKPVPKNPWKDAILATKQPNHCWQSPVHNYLNSSFNQYVLKSVPDLDVFFANGIVSEDCLYLNIYVQNSDISESNRTVMVWIHGGGFMSGSIGSLYYDGSTLAAKSDVIVVAINYRLGVFGFLSAEDTELTGNYGLYDQVLALEWVKKHIGAFGGDPNNVVLFGESAGAISVGYHLISPLSQNLFSRAILQSGNPLVPIILAGHQTQTKAAIDLISGALCPLKTTTDNSTKRIDEMSISCLRQVNASIVFELSQEVFKQRIGAFLPIEGNDFLTELPDKLVENKTFFSKKEILIGTNAFEGAYFSKFGPFGKYWFDDKIDSNFTKQTVINVLNQTVPEEYHPFLGMVANRALDGLSNGSDPSEVWNRYVKIVGDIIFVCSDHQFINQYSASNQTVFYYQFNPKTKINTWSPVWAVGAVHGEEILYVFGLPLIVEKMFTLEEIQLSESVTNVWTNFAKKGKPSCCESWLPYRYDEPLYMSFDFNSIHMNQGFPGFKCDQYYETLIEELRKYIRSENKIPLSL